MVVVVTVLMRLASDLLVVRFVYGLSFFVLGVVAWLQRRWPSSERLAKTIWALALFAFFHAFADWGAVFIPLQVGPGQVQLGTLLQGVKAFATAVSFGFLLYFALALLWPRHERVSRPSAAGITSVVVFGLWLVAFFVYPFVATSTDVYGWYLAAEIWARYVLGLPACLLSGVGVARQAAALRRDRLPGRQGELVGLSAAFVLYGLLAGLVVPYGPFGLARILNNDSFLRALGIPVEAFRAVLGFAITFFIYRLLDALNIRTVRRMQAAEAERAILQERDRIARDLHDGTLQTLYGVGLGLKQIEGMAEEDPAGVRRLARDLTDGLQAAISDLRHYVWSLKDEEITAADLTAHLRALVRQLEHVLGLSVDLVIEDGGQTNWEQILLPVTWREDIMAIVRESLSNVARHAGVSEAEVLLAWQGDTLVLRVTDRGVGFDPEAVCEREPRPGSGQGLANMKRRTERAGGICRVESAPGAGTQVSVLIPLVGYRKEGEGYSHDAGGRG